MFYEEKGVGPPLILIMGITAPGKAWDAHVEDWANHFRCIMPDNRGVGNTDKPNGIYTSEQMADDYCGLMDNLGIGEARVVGVSMGSIIAQQLAIRHPDKVSSAVLMCPWARCDSYTRSVFRHMEVCKAHLTPSEFTEWIQLLIFAKSSWDNDASFAELLDARQESAVNPMPQPLHGLIGQARACIDHNTKDKLTDIKCPCLVIGGKQDVFTPKWMAKEVADGIPDSEIHLYENAGHAFHWEIIEDFNPRVRNWLKTH